MKKNDLDFMKGITLDLQTRHAARRILKVAEGADKQELKKAYRKASLKFHPDKNLNDPNANKKFALVKCAYELLAKDKPCRAILEEIDSWQDSPDDDKYDLNNPWGHFLWWREKFFG